MSTPRIRFASSFVDDVASVLCAGHEHAHQYLAQAPVLAVLVCRTFPSHITYGEADRFAALAGSGAKLRDVLASCGAPLPFRKLVADALRTGDGMILEHVARLDPSTVSQVIPTDSQRVWLDGIKGWLRLLPNKKAERAQFSVEWIARRLCEDLSRYEQVDTIVDAIARGRLALNPRWSWQRALDEVNAWHRRINDEAAMRVAMRQAEIARTFDDVICQAPLPDAAELDGYTFEVLRTIRRLREEGQAMRHCVASYARDVKRGDCAIVSIKKEGVHVATLEIGRHGTVEQLKAHCNQAPSPHVRAACDRYALGHWKAQAA